MDNDLVTLLARLAEGTHPYSHLQGEPPRHLPPDRLRAAVDEAKRLGYVKGYVSDYGDERSRVEELSITDEGRHALATRD